MNMNINDIKDMLFVGVKNVDTLFGCPLLNMGREQLGISIGSGGGSCPIFFECLQWKWKRFSASSRQKNFFQPFFFESVQSVRSVPNERRRPKLLNESRNPQLFRRNEKSFVSLGALWDV